MQTNPHKEFLITGYLLGRLPEQEQRLLEEEFFNNDAFFEQVLAAEDELIDAYVRGELTEDENKRFESCFLNSPQRRQRVETAMLLRQYVSNAVALEIQADRPPRASWWQSAFTFLRQQNPVTQFALAFLLLAVFGLIAWTVVFRRNFPPASGQQAQRSTAPYTQTPTQEANSQKSLNPPSNTTQHIVATLALAPGSLRSAGENNTLSISPDTSQVQLQLYLEQDEYKSYRAELERIQDRNILIWKQKALESQPADSAKSILLKIPAKLFSTGDYKLRLSGIASDQSDEPVADYNFRVVNK